MNVSLSIENLPIESLPIEERIALVRQVWGSIVMDYKNNTVKNLHAENVVNKQKLQQVLDSLPDIPNESEMFETNTSNDVRSEEEHKKALQQRFLTWRQDYEKAMAECDDEWTNEDHDKIWDNLRDKTDTGREVTF